MSSTTKIPFDTKKIATIIEMIDSKKIYLPAIQRKYVWKEEQIASLMDSIMRGYPFGTFLFWKINKKTVNQKGYSMYEFIKYFHERDNYKNNPAGILNCNSENDNIYSVLDGQQRLTSLYIALKGSLALKLPHKHRKKDESYPKKEMYFNLLSGMPVEDEENAFEFAFLTAEESKNTTDNTLWYKVKNILSYSKTDEIYKDKIMSSLKYGITGKAKENLKLLFNKFKVEKLINYYEINNIDSIDSVLDIFIRVNSGGTVLSKTDLLFSTIVSYWDSGREKIDDLIISINKIGEHYSFKNDFIMRSCLYVLDLPVSLKVSAFGKDNVTKIEKNWGEISAAIYDTISFMSKLGFTSDNIVSDNAIIPIIYYRYKYGNDSAFKNDKNEKNEIIFNEEMEIRKYMVVSQLYHIFGQSTNTALKTIHTALERNTGKFQLSWLEGLTFSNDISLKCTKNDIKNWLDEYEKGPFTFMLLSLLYPYLWYGIESFHQDHMHPYSGFENDEDLMKISGMDENKIKNWRRLRNTLPNLQLLEGKENEIKNSTPLVDWLKDKKNAEKAKYLPKVNYSLANFEEFIEKRKELMLNKLETLLL